jgi:hypothetical protein
MSYSPQSDVPRDLLTSTVVAQALHAVGDIGVATALGTLITRPRGIEELAQDTGTRPEILARVLRLLAGHGFFESTADGRWRHTEMSERLRPDHPRSFSSIAALVGTSFFRGALGELTHTLRTGEPGANVLDPPGPWAYLKAHPDEGAVFQDAMDAKEHTAIVRTLDLSRYHRLVDVGGGRGSLLDTVLSRYEGMTGVLFDLPAVVADVPARADLTVVGGDFFADPLPIGDAYLLRNVVHDWGDKESVAILSAVARAGGPGSAVLLVETLLPEDAKAHWSLTSDVLMSVLASGQERTAGAYRALLDAAGIEVDRVTSTQESPFSVIWAHVR